MECGETFIVNASHSSLKKGEKQSETMWHNVVAALRRDSNPLSTAWQADGATTWPTVTQIATN